MCKMCDGQTYEEALDEMAALIDEHGWMGLGVGPSPGEPGWWYTVGLVQNFGHPELIMTGLDGELGPEVFARMVGFVERGERLAPGESCCLRIIHTRVGRVHPTHLRDGGRFNWWFRYYEWRSLDAPSLSAMQVVWEDERGRRPTNEHPWRSQPLLALPSRATRTPPRRPTGPGHRRPTRKRR